MEENIKFFLRDLKASNYNLSFIESVESLIQENKELKEKINKIKDLCDTKPYVAYTLYGDLLHESDDILEILEGDK